MSWLYSQALVAAFSEANCLDGTPSALSSGSPTPQAFLPPDRMTAFSRPSRFGMTFAPLTDTRGAELLTWFLAVFPARTFPPLARAQESTASGAGCGRTWPESLARWDRASSSWKTPQCSLLEGLDEFSETWPRWGMMRAGECSALTMPAHLTSETESGLLPTPSASDSITDKMTGGATVYMDKFGKPRRKTPNGSASTGLARLVQYTWPTPTASLGTKGGLVTPAKAREGGTLIEALSARTFATPTARDWRSGKASQATHDKNSRPLSEQIGGSLNPTWVEWLQGWPLGWTDLKPLVTVKSLCVPPQPIECLFQSLEMSE